MANANVLEGKKATVWPDQDCINQLKQNKSIYKNEPVVVDGKIITGSGPESTELFAESINKILKLIKKEK
ncbi:MAG: DJ-1/PfpI family protein [bacterium]